MPRLKVLLHDPRPHHFTRDSTIPLAAVHTLTRVGGPKPGHASHGPSLHTAKTGNEAHHTVPSLIFRTHLARRPPARSPPLAVRERQQHTLDRSTPEQVVEAAPQLSLCTSSSTLS